ncbi:MAG: aromatic ring-hydroxylating oxygenase subunit alpha, partial [Burkholderiales bacterium]
MHAAATTESIFRGDIADLPSRIDLSAHITPERFAIEKERIWRRAWLAIGHTQELPHKGSYFVYDIPTFEMSLLVVRGQDDRVRAFHNVCRHRGNKVVRSGRGTRPNFTCNFHGWVYDAQGELKLITDEKEFEDVDRATLGLMPVHAEVWNTLIFVNLAPTPPCTLAEWLGTLHGQYDGYFEGREKVAA